LEKQQQLHLRLHLSLQDQKFQMVTRKEGMGTTTNITLTRKIGTMLKGPVKVKVETLRSYGIKRQEMLFMDS